MPACHKSDANARPFVITPYVEGADGVLVPKLPAQGPCGELDDQPCQLAFDHRRERKTGPAFPLTVLRCSPHGRRAFTLYPPGHVPYGRQRIAPVAVDGGAVHSESGDAVEAFGSTAFVAAVDAANGRAWSRDGREPWWPAQGRWLARLMRWVGVAVDIDDELRARLAATLGVAQLLLRDQARRIAAAPGYRRRGEAVVMVLAALGRDARVYYRLVLAGHEAGLWGRPLRWDADAARLRRLPFRPCPARSPPGD